MALPELGEEGAGNVSASAVVAWQGGYVALGTRYGDRSVAYGAWSADGLVWQPSEGVEPYLGGGFSSFLETPRGLMAVVGSVYPEDEGTQVWTTETGQLWVHQPTIANAFAGVRVYAVEVVPGGFLAFGRPFVQEVEATRIWTSVDGLVWSPESELEAHFAKYLDLRIQAVPSGYIAMARDPELLDPGTDLPMTRSWWSADLIEWEPIEPYGDGRGLVSVKVAADGVLGIVDTACAGCINRPDYWHSTDGRTWLDIEETDRPFATAASALSDEITVVEETFVAVPVDVINDPDVLVSRDGLEWRRVEGILTGDLDLDRSLPTFNGVAAGPNGIVGAGVRRSQSALETDRHSALWVGQARDASRAVGRPPGPVEVELGEPVGPTDAELTLLVSDLGCHGYETELGRTVTEIEYGPETVVVRVGVLPLPGDCPGTSPTEVTVPLTEPVGDRRVELRSLD